MLARPFAAAGCVHSTSSRNRSPLSAVLVARALPQPSALAASSETLAVPPLGRGRVNLEKDLRGGDVITLRLRRKPAS